MQQLLAWPVSAISPEPAIVRTITGLLGRRLAAAVILVMSAACSVTPPGPVSYAAPGPNPGNPRAPTVRNVTGFSAAVRCMDERLHVFGVRDVAVMLEELPDKTGRAAGSARDMMISALADMTRRSRALQVIAFGSDSGNTFQLLQTAGRSNPFAIVPDYSIRGAVSQFDDEIARRTVQAGFSLASLFGFRTAANISFSALGFDASVLSTQNLAIVPGVSSKNSVVIGRQEDSTSDGLAQLTKAGINFAFSVNRNEGISQGLRNMVELASVELIGKLLRLPYWHCIDGARGSAEVEREMDDWYVSMKPADRIRYFQENLRLRKFWDGPISGETSEMFEAALAAYREAIGLAADGGIDRAFFVRFLDADVPVAPAQAFSEPPSAATETPAASAGSASASPSNAGSPAGASASSASGSNSAQAVTVGAGNGSAAGQSNSDGGSAATAGAATAAPGTPAVAPIVVISTAASSLTPGARYQIDVAVNRDAYVYCYVMTSAGRIHRIFPNRFQRDPRLAANRSLRLPGRGRFVLLAPARSDFNEVACLAAAREVYNDLPPPLRWGDFSEIRLTSFADIQLGFESAAGMPVSLSELRLPLAGGARGNPGAAAAGVDKEKAK